MSIIKGKCNEQTKTIEGLRGELSEKTNSLEEALRHNKHKYVTLDNIVRSLIYNLLNSLVFLNLPHLISNHFINIQGPLK